MQKTQKQLQKRVQARQKVVNNLKNRTFKSGFDVLGSYTGCSADNPYEKPIQDADDL